jgi:ubiquinone/menaquinone biosynthesis C-methylase UbiE
MSEWFENESFWSDFYPYLFDEARFDEAHVTIRKLLKLVRPKGKTALDLCCGPGRCSLALAKRRYKVTGVDLSPYLLRKARRFGKQHELEIEWVKSDMRRFVRPESFGLVINMYSSFGYFDNKDDDLTVLGNVYASLRPGGALVIEMKSKEWICRHLRDTTSNERPDGSLLVQRHRLFDNCTRIENRWILVRKDRSIEHRFHHTIYSAQEMIDRLRAAGFSSIDIYGDLEGAEYTFNSNRIIVVGRK